MSSRRTRRVSRGSIGVGAGLFALGLTVMSAVPASAAGIHPSGLLRNDEGASNGCTVTIQPVTVGQFSDGAGDFFYGYTVRTDLACDASAGVTREALDFGLWEVKRDGTLKEIKPLPNTIGNFGHGPGLTGGSLAISVVCAPGTTHTLQVKAKGRTMVVERDPDPFSRTVSWQQTVNC